jgi:hypothetical protein
MKDVQVPNLTQIKKGYTYLLVGIRLFTFGDEKQLITGSTDLSHQNLPHNQYQL